MGGVVYHSEIKLPIRVSIWFVEKINTNIARIFVWFCVWARFSAVYLTVGFIVANSNSAAHARQICFVCSQRAFGGFNYTVSLVCIMSHTALGSRRWARAVHSHPTTITATERESAACKWARLYEQINKMTKSASAQTHSQTICCAYGGVCTFTQVCLNVLVNASPWRNVWQI